MVLILVDIDYIMDSLDWNNSEERQAKGVELAHNVKCINVFLQPLHKEHNKNVWENCAKILSQRSDEELSPYLIQLLEWLQDMNWPGAFCILSRMKRYERNSAFDFAINTCIKCAKAMNDTVWEDNLLEISKIF